MSNYYFLFSFIVHVRHLRHTKVEPLKFLEPTDTVREQVFKLGDRNQVMLFTFFRF